ncbi:hypothetical protein [Streptomyces sp. MK5]|uniref:hypothetical protein n=1 Tax=Streptomyces sp. MK5 TaxID=3064253 RepID=UPI002740DD8C|nr:hypothetical protein [Streptomyces sp. MK5]
MDAARRLLVVARASLAPRCSQHPNAPVDPTAGDACLFCATNRRRGEAAVVTQAVPLEQVARVVAELGQDEAVCRFGARRVTRAVLRCRNGLASSQESA